MKKYLLFAAGLILSSPLLTAQGQTTPATPATPAVPEEKPAVPATPAAPATPSKPKASGETSTDSERGGKAKGKADFAAFDANGDGSLSQDEVKGDSSIRFKELDRDGNGSVSRAEYESGFKAKPPKATAPEAPKQP